MGGGRVVFGRYIWMSIIIVYHCLPRSASLLSSPFFLFTFFNRLDIHIFTPLYKQFLQVSWAPRQTRGWFEIKGLTGNREVKQAVICVLTAFVVCRGQAKFCSCHGLGW